VDVVGVVGVDCCLKRRDEDEKCLSPFQISGQAGKTSAKRREGSHLAFSLAFLHSFIKLTGALPYLSIS